MTAVSLTNEQLKIIDEIPTVGDFTNIYFYANKSNFDAELIAILNQIVVLSDAVIAGWLNITSRTFGAYKINKDLVLKENIKEHIFLIIALYKHSKEVFESVKELELWFSKENILLGFRMPSDFLDTVSGIRFIDNRLTAIDYGENV